jgi:hypothetical protein
MLDPDFSVRGISAKRRVVGNPWFKRGTLYRAVSDGSHHCENRREWNRPWI